MRNYENYLSVKKICKTITITSTCHFSGIDKAEVEKSIDNLSSSKVATFKNIPTKCLKMASDIYSLFLVAIWNQELLLKENLHRN